MQQAVVEAGKAAIVVMEPEIAAVVMGHEKAEEENEAAMIESEKQYHTRKHNLRKLLLL